jgi:hypothetical protein
VIQVLTDHRERQARERANTLHWQDGPYVFTSRVGTSLEPRTLTRDLSRTVCGTACVAYARTTCGTPA